MVSDILAVLDPSTVTMIPLGGVTWRGGGGVRLKNMGERDLGRERQFIFPWDEAWGDRDLGRAIFFHGMKPRERKRASITIRTMRCRQMKGWDSI
jgi:hypothetical protein